MLRAVARSDGGDVNVSTDERARLVESAVAELAQVAPSDWVSLHAEFVPPSASAHADTPGGPVSLPIPPEALQHITFHQDRSAQLGEPWRRLVIDCDRTGRLSVHTDRGGRAPALRRATWALIGLAALLAVAAVAVFVFGPKGPTPPPRAEAIVVAPPSERQKLALKVITEWSDAASRGDTAAMRALACPTLGPFMDAWTNTLARLGPDQIMYVDGITGFSDDGQTIEARAMFRAHPLSDELKAASAENQKRGGFFYQDYVLTGSGDDLQVCGP
jgi:hypothetical protein